MTVSRLMLVAAALLALVAGETALLRSRPAPPPAAALPHADVGMVITAIEAKLKAQPGDAAGWTLLGQSFFVARRFAESALAYKRAVTLAPANAQNWSSLGEALVMADGNGVSADAQAAFATALARDPDDPRARYFLGVARDLRGDHKGAIDDWLALLRDAPEGAPWSADVRALVAQVGAQHGIAVSERLAGLGPHTSAADVATAAIPGPTPEQMRAAGALPKGQQDAMIDAMVAQLAAKLAASPRNPDGWIMLMRSNVQLGRTAAARDAYARATAANPDAKGGLAAAARELGIER